MCAAKRRRALPADIQCGIGRALKKKGCPEVLRATLFLKNPASEGKSSLRNDEASGSVQTMVSIRNSLSKAAFIMKEKTTIKRISLCTMEG